MLKMKKLIVLLILLVVIPGAFAVYGGSNVGSSSSGTSSPSSGGGGGGGGYSKQTTSPQTGAAAATSTSGSSSSGVCSAGTTYCAGLCCDSTEVCKNGACVLKSLVDDSALPQRTYDSSPSEQAYNEPTTPLPTGYLSAPVPKGSSTLTRILTVLILSAVGIGAYFVLSKKKRRH